MFYLALCAFLIGVGLTTLVAAIKWPEPPVRKPVNLDAEFDASCLRTLELRRQIAARDARRGNVPVVIIPTAQAAPQTISTGGQTWQYIGTIETTCNPRLRSSAPSQRDTRGRFTRSWRRAGGRA